MKELDKKQIASILSKDSKTPGQFLRRYLSAIGISRSEFSEMYGCTRTYVELLCADRVPMGKQVCFKIATLLNISPKFLYSISSKYAMDCYLKDQGFEDFANDMMESKEFKGLLKLMLKLMRYSWNAGKKSNK